MGIDFQQRCNGVCTVTGFCSNESQLYTVSAFSEVYQKVREPSRLLLLILSLPQPSKLKANFYTDTLRERYLAVSETIIESGQVFIRLARLLSIKENTARTFLF